MSNTNRFLNFKFTPTKLEKEGAKIEKVFGDFEDVIVNQRKKNRLPKLLESIRNIEKKHIAKLIKTLNKMDVLLLIYDYPYHNEKKETKEKINLILGDLYITTVGRTAWSLFQDDTENPFVNELLRFSYKKDRINFIGIENDYIRPMEYAFTSNKGIIRGLVPYLQKSKTSTKTVLKKWKIKEKSMLEAKILWELFAASLKEDFIIKKDGVEYITNYFLQTPSNQYKKLLKIYLEARDYRFYHYQILDQAIRRLMDPREKEEEWSFLSPHALVKVKKWLYTNELKKFFDSDVNSERFEYWKRFIDYMDDVVPIRNPFVAFIYFSDFVVVEFGEMGAAYFYRREGFEKIILPRTKSYEFNRTKSKATKESMLKNQSTELHGISLFITKIDHRGNWQRRFDEHMAKDNRLKI